jgi:multidrug resistance efflux pump
MSIVVWSNAQFWADNFGFQVQLDDIAPQVEGKVTYQDC